jgi:N-acetylglucosaminyl-diphospho-decaprenol L-rhamnosyltransferase
MPRAAIVVVNFGSHDLLARNLTVHSGGPDDVVVVDNYHSPGERDAVTRLCADQGWTLVPLPDNMGFGPGVNAGAQRAAELGCEVIVLVNPDACASAAAVAALREHVLAQPDVLASPWVVTSQGRVEFSGATLFLRDGRLRGLRSGRPRDDLPVRWSRQGTLSWLGGACVAVHLGTFKALGGFDTRYFLYWEDVDLSYRAVQQGYRLEVLADVQVVHDEGGTQARVNQRAKSAGYYRYNCRNRLLFASLRLDRRALLRWVLMTPVNSWDILMRGGKRQLVHSPQLGWAALRGTLEGLAVALKRLLVQQPEHQDQRGHG